MFILWAIQFVSAVLFGVADEFVAYGVVNSLGCYPPPILEVFCAAPDGDGGYAQDAGNVDLS